MKNRKKERIKEKKRKQKESNIDRPSFMMLLRIFQNTTKKLCLNFNSATIIIIL